MRTRMRGGLLAALVVTFACSGAAVASADTVRVDADGVGGWDFNPDPANATPYEFSTAFESIGTGSLHVLPIANTPAPPQTGPQKFIAAHPEGTLVSDLSSISYDFMIDPAGITAGKHTQFYLNVYTLLPGSTSTFFDCRYDYVPSSGSSAAFTNASFAPGDPPTRRSPLACPATMDGMPAGSTIRAIALNVGDTSFSSDQGVGGYYDNVVVAGTAGSTTYDFEATPADKDGCKNGAFADFGFDNQGLCVARVNALTP
jgi:hypothetical protein